MAEPADATRDCPYCDGIGAVHPTERHRFPSVEEQRYLVATELYAPYAFEGRARFGPTHFARARPCEHCWGTGRALSGAELEGWLVALVASPDWITAYSTSPLDPALFQVALRNVRTRIDLGHCGVMFKASFVLHVYNLFVGLHYHTISQLKNSGGTP